MSKASFEIIATSRADLGKGASRRLRRLENNVPGIIYGAEKEATPITVSHKDLMKSLENEAFYSHILTVKVDGAAEKVVLKDLQRHPCKPRILHLDLLRISATHKLTMHIPLHFLNQDTAPGVKEGGIVTHHVVELEVKCLPDNLPEFIAVDMGQVELNGIVHMSDIKLPQGVELTAHIDEAHDLPVASIHRPRAIEVEETEKVEEPTAEAAPAATAAPATEEKKKK